MLPFGVVVVGTPRRIRDVENIQRGRAVGQVEGYAAAMRDLGRGRCRSRSRGRGLPRITYSSPTRTRDRSRSRHRSSRYEDGSKSKELSTIPKSTAVTKDAYDKYKHHKDKHEEYRNKLQGGYHSSQPKLTYDLSNGSGNKAISAKSYNRESNEVGSNNPYDRASKAGSGQSYDRESRYRELEQEIRYKDAELNKYRIEKDEWRREQGMQNERERQRQERYQGRGANFDPSRAAASRDEGFQYRQDEDTRQAFYPAQNRVRFQDERRERRDY